jgi:mRNA-degrading endonuclease RelE of RelBE toxin-antitoxin system
MPFKLVLASSFIKCLKDIKHLKEVKADLEPVIDIVASDPLLGKKLKGNLAGIYNIRVSGRDYRLVYRPYACCSHYEDCPHPTPEEWGIEECQGVVQLLHVLTRQDCDNLYSVRKKYHDLSLLDMDLLD